MYVISNGSMITMGVCGRAPNGATFGYTATATTLKVYMGKGSETQENVFTLKTN